MAMVIDNTTDYPYDSHNTIHTDYGIEIIWNAAKGLKELRHVEYMNRIYGDITAYRSRRTGEAHVKYFSIAPFLDTPFVIKWVYNSKWYCMLRKDNTIVIRNEDLTEFL
jgi:hypothetical protein